MDWKSFFKRVLIIGILLIPVNLSYACVPANPFYTVASLKSLILLIGISLLAAVSIFRFVYRRTEKFRIIQSIATIILSEIIGFLSITGILIFFIIIS
jgi:hypothetical protein